MPRLTAHDPGAATPALAPLYEQVRTAFGGPVPNLMRTFANSPYAGSAS